MSSVPSQCTLHRTHPHVPLGHTAKLPLTPVIQKEQGETREADDDRPDPYFMEPLVESDRVDRESLHITPADYGRRWRATFRAMTGDAPVCRPGDRDKARRYWGRLREAMVKGGWSRAEWTQLYRIERVWRARAHGKDARFE